MFNERTCSKATKMKKILNYLVSLTIFIIPFSVERYIKGVWITLTDVLVVFICILCFILLLKNKKQLEFKKLPLLWLIISLFVCFFISIFNSFNILLTLKEIAKFIIIFAFFYVLVYTIDNELLLILPQIITVCAFIVALWFITDFLLGNVSVFERAWHRIFGPYRHLNSLGTYFVITIPFSFFLVSTANKLTYKIILCFVVFAQMTALILTFSRGNWVALGFSLFLLTLLSYKLKGVLYFLLFVFVSFILSSLFIAPAEIYKRFFSTFDLQEGAILSRKDHMYTAILLMKKYPITGVGLGNFQLAAKKHFNKDLTEIAHNVFLHYGSEAGVFSIVILFIIITKYFKDIFFIYKNLKVERKLQLLILCTTCSFAGLLISVQFGDPFVRSIKEFFALLLALPYAIKLTPEKKNIICV